MVAGTVEDDAGQNEDHPEQTGQVSEVLLRSMARVLVRHRRRVQDHVGHEGGEHERQADAGEHRCPTDLTPDVARMVYHEHG